MDYYALPAIISAIGILTLSAENYKHARDEMVRWVIHPQVAKGDMLVVRLMRTRAKGISFE